MIDAGKVQSMARKPTKMTLCWRCAHACGNCDWSAEGTPVKGWKAKRTIVRNMDGSGKCIGSFQVIECPQFEDDTDRYNQRLEPSVNDRWHPNPVARDVMSRKIQYPEVVIHTNKSDARKRIEALPTSELYNLIETRLSGVEKEIAKLTLIGKMRACDVAEVVYYAEDYVKKMLRVIWRKLGT